MHPRIASESALRDIHSIARKASNFHWMVGLVTFVIAGFFVGYSVNSLSKKSYLVAMTHEAETLLELTSSYVAAYSGLQGLHDGTYMPVPAKFRATASDLFNQKQVLGERLVAKMVGVPGREIETPPIDQPMADELSKMISSGNVYKNSQLTLVDGKPVLRSLFPSIASKQSCVRCHNHLQPTQATWQIGDMMGAYVIDRGVKKPFERIMTISIALGLIGGILALLVYLMIRQHLDLRRTSNTLQNLANTDPLTGCLNRRALYEQVVDQFRPTSGRGALLALDLDHFKQINDRYGHAAGDKVLMQFALRVRAILRESDIFARTGGEEFLIYLTDARSHDVNQISARIVEAIAADSICIGNDTVSVSVSIGAVRMVPDRRFTFEHYMKVADCFLYRAKESGRNQVYQIQPI